MRGAHFIYLYNWTRLDFQSLKISIFSDSRNKIFFYFFSAFGNKRVFLKITRKFFLLIFHHFNFNGSCLFRVISYKAPFLHGSCWLTLKTNLNIVLKDLSFNTTTLWDLSFCWACSWKIKKYKQFQLDWMTRNIFMCKQINEFKI